MLAVGSDSEKSDRKVTLTAGVDFLTEPKYFQKLLEGTIVKKVQGQDHKRTRPKEKVRKFPNDKDNLEPESP